MGDPILLKPAGERVASDMEVLVSWSSSSSSKQPSSSSDLEAVEELSGTPKQARGRRYEYGNQMILFPFLFHTL